MTYNLVQCYVKMNGPVPTVIRNRVFSETVDYSDDAEKNWTYKWENCPYYNDDGSITYTYFIEEAPSSISELTQRGYDELQNHDPTVQRTPRAEYVFEGGATYTANGVTLTPNANQTLADAFVDSISNITFTDAFSLQSGETLTANDLIYEDKANNVSVYKLTKTYDSETTVCFVKFT